LPIDFSVFQKQKWFKLLDIQKNDVVQNLRRVQKQKINAAFKFFGDIDSMINSLNETQT